MNLYANLHLHSTHSDGKYTPEELVKMAYDEGYRALSITDHDTITANEEGRYYAEKLGMEYIFGIEFTTIEGYHIVGLDFDPNYPPMKKYLDDLATNETEQTRMVFELAQKNGNLLDITWQEVLDYNKGIRWLCNEHVFRAMQDKGLVTEKDYNEFFDVNFDKQRWQVPKYCDFLNKFEVIKLIREAGGIAIFAHPHVRLQYVDELMEAGLNGIEVYHPDLTAEEQREAMKIAYEKNLFVAGGTDHSGLCGGMYHTYKEPEKSVYYLIPNSFGTMKQHFEEIKARSLALRIPAPEYSLDRPNKKDIV